MKALECAVLKCLEYRIKNDTMSCSSCFAADVFNTYNNREYPCDGKPHDADECAYGEKSNCKNCKEAWIKAFEILEEKGIDIEDTEKFNC